MSSESTLADWAGADNSIARRLLQLNDTRRTSFKTDPGAFRSASNTVANAAEGDYKDRQLFELVQNAVDAMSSNAGAFSGGRVAVVLTPAALYCANEGRPFSEKGFEALGWPNVSGKSDEQTIGQFGLGFRSVAHITNNPEVVSRSCSIRYSREELLNEWFSDTPEFKREFEDGIINLLAFAIPIDPKTRFQDDAVMQDLMKWASTVIKLPLDRDSQSSFVRLRRSMEEFPPEFLLFCRHLERLEFEVHDPGEITARSWWFGRSGKVESRQIGDNVTVRCDRMSIPTSSGSKESNDWLVFSDVEIPIEDLLDRENPGLSRARKRKSDGTLIPVTLSWAVNLSSPPNVKGRFWFFFPTQDEVSLRGIVNAPWDTNAGRTSLLPPVTNGFNELLMQRLVELIIIAIPEIARDTPSDVGRFLDVLPSQGDEETSIAARHFVPLFWRIAGGRAVVPNLDGEFCTAASLSRWPAEIVSGVTASNQYVVEVAKTWASLSTDRMFPSEATFKSQRRNRCLNDLFANAVPTGGSL